MLETVDSLSVKKVSCSREGEKMLPRHVMKILGNCFIVLAVLITGCNAQADSVVEVDLSDNTNRSVTIPRVSSLLITVPNLYQCTSDSTSLGNNRCSHTVPAVNVTYKLIFTRPNTPPLDLTVTVDDNRKVACSRYIFNTSEQPELNFTCIPVVTRSDPVSVAGAAIRWRRFNNSDDMDQFISGIDVSGRSILNSTSDIEFESSGMVTNSSIVIRGQAYRIGFYVPTVLLTSGEEHTQPFVVYLDPRITSTYEFSFIEVAGTVNFNQMSCEVQSFPQANVTWQRQDGNNMPLPAEQNNVTNQLTLISFITKTLVFDTVEYSDAGVYDCIAENEYSTAEPSSLSVRLRVHDRLRPLWPAIGLIGIFIVTPLFIIGGHFFDKLWGKTDNTERDGLVSASGEKRSYSVSDSESANDTGHYHKGIRRVSSARQELLTQEAT